MGGNDIKFGNLTTLGKMTPLSMRKFFPNQVAMMHRVAPGMSMDSSLYPYGQYGTKKVQSNQTQNTNQAVSSQANSYSSLVDAMGLLNKTLSSLDSTNSQSISSGNYSNQDQEIPTTSGVTTVGNASVSDNGASYSGYVQGVSQLANSGYDTSKVDSIIQQLNTNSSLSSKNLIAMQNDLSMQSVSASSALASAQADFSNIRSQQLTAQANVQRLESAVDSAETAKDVAQKGLDNSTSNLNSSIKARDTLDEQLSAVNEEYKNNCDNVKKEESNKSNAQGEVSSAKQSKATAQSAVSVAEQSLISAETTLAGTPKNLENGAPNPQYEVAKAAVEKAKLEKKQAHESLRQAEELLASTEKKLDSANKALEQAQSVKHQTLQNLEKTDLKYKDMAAKCEQLQTTVENNQKSYDTSLETFDDTNANFERLNTELESQQGILNQLEVYENKLENLKLASNKIKETQLEVEEQLKARNAVTQEMLQKAAETEGCSASKTPAENVLSMKNGPQQMSEFAYTSKPVNKNGVTWFDVSNMKALEGMEVINEDSSFFEKSGCFANSDGSYTNSENGYTWINLKDNTWVRTDVLNSKDEYINLAREKYPEALAAAERADAQHADFGIQGWQVNQNLGQYGDISYKRRGFN